MTELEIKSLKHTNGHNNYVVKSNADNHWVAFTKSVVDELRNLYGDDFNIIIYWNKQDDLIDYVYIPMCAVSHLFTDEHLSASTTRFIRWNFTISNNLLCLQSNRNYSVDISSYININIKQFNLVSYNTRHVKHWIVPFDSSKFDIVNALERFGFVDWKQRNNFNIGDIIYVYITKPEQCIRYRFCVTEINLTFEQSQNDIEFWNDKNEFYLGDEHNRYCRFVLNGELEAGDLCLHKLISKGLKGAPQSAMKVVGEIKDYIESYFSYQVEGIQFIDEAESIIEFTEGATSLSIRSSRRRNRNARRKCIELMGAVCTICGFDFEKHYGNVGKGFIHVHHKTPISERGGNYKIDINSDLVPVCPNCHAMLHKEIDGKCLSVEELSRVLNRQLNEV